jgi:hypothetical protein
MAAIKGEVIDIDTARLSEAEARSLTEEVKADAAALWTKLLRLYEGGAHLALGYASWGSYYATEFGESEGRGKQLLRAARVDAVIRDEGTSVPLPRNEAVARQLAPLLSRPASLRAKWVEAIERYGPSPTAEQVRSVVRPHANSWQTMVGRSIRTSASLDLGMRGYLVALEEVLSALDDIERGHTDDGDEFTLADLRQDLLTLCANLRAREPLGVMPWEQ